MLISLDWIRDFVSVPTLPAKDIGQRFTLGTAEVEEVITSNQAFLKVTVVEIVSIEKHPEADKLNLVTFKISPIETRKVVCGASNVRIGLKVPYAPIDTLLPNGMLLTPKKIRGVLSEGMLCSEEELGFAKESSGLMELPNDSVVGTTLAQLLNKHADTILNVDNKSLTHRPDLWGHLGMAREFSALFQVPLKNPFDDEWKRKLKSQYTNADAPITPLVDSRSSSLGYWCLAVDNVSVGPTPDWIKNRLEAVGLRSINNLVDISNYVMLELGIPLHIFDREKIKGKQLKIHTLDQSQNFKTLDEVERMLIPGDTVISDESGALVLAGIMGGASSAVSDNTNKILIEVANWKASDTRKTSVRLGLRTDSSLRYEKSLDSMLLERTLLRTLEMVQKLCPTAKVIGKAEYAGPDLSKTPFIHISTSAHSISRQLGKELTEEQIVTIFKSLDFKVEKSGPELRVTIPSYRATKDICIEADLVEEVGRVIGFDNISEQSPKLNISPVKLSPMHKTFRQIRDFLTMSCRCSEVMTYPLIGEELLKETSWPAKLNQMNPTIVNALSTDRDRLRTSMIPSFLECSSLNQKHFDEFRLFEIGRIYPLSSAANFVDERTVLTLAYFSRDNDYIFTELYSDFERLLNSLNLPFDFIAPGTHKLKADPSFFPEEWTGRHPYQLLDLRVMGKICGGIGGVHPLMLKNLKIRGSLIIAQLDLSFFLQSLPKDKTRYFPLEKYPRVVFDCSVVDEQRRHVGQAVQLLKNTKLKELIDVSVVDVFKIDSEKQSITLRCVFYDSEQTLAHDTIKNLETQIISALEKEKFFLRR